MWASKTPNGPSLKMHVQNVHTMDELKMTGNCLKGSRGVLSFDQGFEGSEWGRLVKEVFTHVRSFARLRSDTDGIDWRIDIRSAVDGAENQAVYRPYPYVFHVGLEDLVSQLPGSLISHVSTHSILDGAVDHREGPSAAKRTTADVPGGDWPPVRADTDTDI